MNYLSKKVCFSIICLSSIFYSFSQNPDFKHLDVKFLKIVQPYTNYSSNVNRMPRKKDGLTTLKLNLTNKGKTPIYLNLNNVYVIDRSNNTYPVSFLSPLASKKKTIKSYKSLKQTLSFELPHNHQPVKLLIEDWQFPLYE